MALVVLLGGARSGKSRLAVELAAADGGDAVVVATAEARDAEMRRRIEAHRAGRPAGWTTVEEPVALDAALGAVEGGRAVVVDCLSLWAANLLERGEAEEAILAAAGRAAATAAARSGLTVAVSNEVGLGVVPATLLGRAYRDLLGAVNRKWVAAAARAALVVAGRALPLQDARTLLVPNGGERA